MAKVAKTITFTYKGKEYTLEFDRKQVERMERQGFNISEIDAKPMSLLPRLFAGAFQKHHRNLNPELIEEMLSQFTNRDALFGKLSEMYSDPVLTLFEEPEENEGNINWDPNW